MLSLWNPRVGSAVRAADTPSSSPATASGTERLPSPEPISTVVSVSRPGSSPTARASPAARILSCGLGVSLWVRLVVSWCSLRLAKVYHSRELDAGNTGEPGAVAVHASIHTPVATGVHHALGGPRRRPGQQPLAFVVDDIERAAA